MQFNRRQVKQRASNILILVCGRAVPVRSSMMLTRISVGSLVKESFEGIKAPSGVSFARFPFGGCSALEDARRVVMATQSFRREEIMA
ncbi:hypothetical protein BDV95DRAFT_580820 [Massariosphaeria phaeospora]|uniref:Uncharacterized protein n=1 Tax=Massariosphaeria phaeospora TaxID=100035 RepID=A0A7C8M4V7_9PLEO|nr:hypothetical protein BDV95DRAFT_580820 [Massariosphaeria phaeospora]